MVPYTHTVIVSVVCPLLCVAGSVGLHVFIYLAVFSLAAPSFLALQGALRCDFCNGVVPSDVANPGELSSSHCCQ